MNNQVSTKESFTGLSQDRSHTPNSGRGLQMTKRNKPKVVSNHFFVKQTVMNNTNG